MPIPFKAAPRHSTNPSASVFLGSNTLQWSSTPVAHHLFHKKESQTTHSQLAPYQ